MSAHYGRVSSKGIDTAAYYRLLSTLLRTARLTRAELAMYAPNVSSGGGSDDPVDQWVRMQTTSAGFLENNSVAELLLGLLFGFLL